MSPLPLSSYNKDVLTQQWLPIDAASWTKPPLSSGLLALILCPCRPFSEDTWRVSHNKTLWMEHPRATVSCLFRENKIASLLTHPETNVLVLASQFHMQIIIWVWFRFCHWAGRCGEPLRSPQRPQNVRKQPRPARPRHLKPDVRGAMNISPRKKTHVMADAPAIGKSQH